MAEHASDYHRGDMDIQEQVSTFHLFGTLTKWVSLITAVTILVLTLWFATGAGFFGGLFVGVVTLVVGVWVLRERKHGR